MRSLHALKIEATKAAKCRGHKMGAWAPVYNGGTWKVCHKCGAPVIVDPNPPANGIDICGAAVAVNCTS